MPTGIAETRVEPFRRRVGYPVGFQAMTYSLGDTEPKSDTSLIHRHFGRTEVSVSCLVDVVGMERFELSASCSQSRRANQAALHPGYSCASLLTVGPDDPRPARYFRDCSDPHSERYRADILEGRGSPMPITNAEISREKSCG